MQRVKARSMLAVESLLMIHDLAQEAGGTVLEIGAYMGGGTVAAAMGLKAAAARGARQGHVVSVDRGGAYLTHPQLPTADIYTDWKETLERFGMTGKAGLIEGFTWRAETQARIRAACGPEPVRLVILDADGFVFGHLHGLLDLLASDCLFVIDDYNLQGATKTEWTAAIVDRAVGLGALEPWGVLPWATWFGRVTPAFAQLGAGLAATELTEREAFLMARDGNTDNRNPPGGFQPLH